MNDQHTFATLLEACRIQRGFSKHSLAEATGISTRQIGSYCSGKQEPGFRYLGVLCEVLQVPATWFYENLPPDYCSTKE